MVSNFITNSENYINEILIFFAKFATIMKKILVTFMAVFYLAVASGAGVHIHYCMDKLVSWSLYETKRQTCGYCGMEKKESSKKSCCKDIHKSPKVDKAQHAHAQLLKFQQSAVIVPQLKLVAAYLFSAVADAPQEARSNAPPIAQKLPIFIKNCTYRI
jgi:hypothetical protein